MFYARAVGHESAGSGKAPVGSGSGVYRDPFYAYPPIRRRGIEAAVQREFKPPPESAACFVVPRFVYFGSGSCRIARRNEADSIFVPNAAIFHEQFRIYNEEGANENGHFKRQSEKRTAALRGNLRFVAIFDGG